jgi:hypothetical protein
MEYKLRLNAVIRSDINGNMMARREQNQSLRKQLAEHYRKRNESIKETIA